MNLLGTIVALSYLSRDYALTQFGVYPFVCLNVQL